MYKRTILTIINNDYIDKLSEYACRLYMHVYIQTMLGCIKKLVYHVDKKIETEVVEMILKHLWVMTIEIKN